MPRRGAAPPHPATKASSAAVVTSLVDVRIDPLSARAASTARTRLVTHSRGLASTVVSDPLLCAGWDGPVHLFLHGLDAQATRKAVPVTQGDNETVKGWRGLARLAREPPRARRPGRNTSCISFPCLKGT